MKNKLIAGIAMSAMLLGALAATPAQSQHRDDRWGVDSNRNSPYYGRQVGYPSYGHDHRNKNNDAIMAGVAVLIIGGMIVGAAQKQQPTQQPYQTYPEPQYPVYVPQTYCRDVPVRNVYGNIVAYQRACWQQ